MPKLSTQKISKRMVDGLSKHGDPGVVWDRDLAGFGVRLYPSGRITYVVQSRGPSGSRRVTLGKHGVITPYQARKRAASDDRPYQGRRGPPFQAALSRKRSGRSGNWRSSVSPGT